MIYKFFEKKSSGTIAAAVSTNKFAGVAVKSEISETSQLFENLKNEKYTHLL